MESWADLHFRGTRPRQTTIVWRDNKMRGNSEVKREKEAPMSTYHVHNTFLGEMNAILDYGDELWPSTIGASRSVVPS